MGKLVKVHIHLRLREYSHLKPQSPTPIGLVPVTH
jgi:hypothetical protein